MAEPVGIRLAVRIDGQDLRGERLAQSAFDGGLIRASHLRQELAPDRSSRDGGDAQDPLGVFGEGRDPRHQDIPEGRREDVPGVARAGREELLDEEGIALRTSLDRIEQRDRGAMAEDGGDLAVELRPAEATISIRRTRGKRSISDSHGRSGCRRFSSSVRYVPMDREPFALGVAGQE
jgi:hypothetical protein